MKLYTLEDARALLPQVIPVLERLRIAYTELRAAQAAVAAHSRGASADGSLIANPWEKGGEDTMGALSDNLQSAARRLDSWGIELKDPEKGLIDFFHRREGRTVYLCYLLGEPEITFWHELSAGFAGRQPV